MPEGDIAVVTDAFRAMRSGGVDAWVERLTDDVDYRAIEGAPDDRGPLHGKEAVRAYLQEWFEMFEEFIVEPVEVIEAGPGVVVVLRFGGRAKLSGVKTEQTLAIAYAVRDGKIAFGREYSTRQEALEARPPRHQAGR